MFMSARTLLLLCLALIVASITIVPASAHLGVIHNSAPALSTLALLGGIAAAFLTMGAEMNRQNSAGNKKI